MPSHTTGARFRASNRAALALNPTNFAHHFLTKGWELTGELSPRLQATANLKKVLIITNGRDRGPFSISWETRLNYRGPERCSRKRERCGQRSIPWSKNWEAKTLPRTVMKTMLTT